MTDNALWVLREKTEALYAGLATEPPPRWTAERCGVALDDFHALSTLPLREVSRSHIWSFADLTPSPPVREMRYLLPRWSEILSAGEIVRGIDVACDLSHLKWSGFPENWDRKDVALIETCLLALLQAVIDDPSRFARYVLGGVEMNYAELVLMAGVSASQVVALLDAQPVSVKKRMVLNHLERGTKALEFTHLDGAEAGELARWVRSCDPVGILENAFVSASSEAEEWRISERLSWLEAELGCRPSAERLI